MAEEVVFFIGDLDFKCVFEEDGSLYIKARYSHIRLDRDQRDEFVAWVRAWGRYYPGKENHGEERVVFRLPEGQ